MATVTQKEINQIIRKACDTFRGVIDPSQYKDYILTMLFIKYVSDIYKEKYQEYLVKYNNDTERAEYAMKHERFIVPEQSSFDYLYDHRNDTNIWELINTALIDFEEANREKLSSEDWSGLFRNIDFNTSNLWEPKDKNERLKNLLIDFSNEKLNLAPKHLDGKDVIGNVYEFLISNFASDAGKKAWEFFTPPEVSTLVARLTKSAPWSRICDPTCGSGSLLIKAWKEVWSNDFALFGQEANGTTRALAIMNMFLHEYDNAVIRRWDTLNNPKLKEWDKLMKFDTVVANPPFSLDKRWADNAGSDTHHRFRRWVPPKSKWDWAFISHMIETTYEDRGKVWVVVPHGVLFRGAAEGRIRQATIEENILEAVIWLPANLFFGTGIPAAILIFNRAKAKWTNTDILFIDASQWFETGKNQNKLREQDIAKIVDTYNQFRDGKLSAGVVEEKYSYVATFDEVRDNDFNLNIPRYVDTFEEEDEIDIVAVQTEIDALTIQLTESEAKMQQYIKDLGFGK